MFNITLDELEIFYKFCYNRVDYDMFHKIMKKKYSDDNYIMDKWSLFSRDQIGFIISRKEEVLFDEIVNEIKRIGYRG